MASLDDALSQMLGAGMPPLPEGGLRVNTQRIVRYGPKKRAWYRLYESLARNGRAYIHGAFGFWGLIDAQKIETDWSGVDEAEQARMRREAALAEERELEKRAQRAKFAANRARVQWDSANRLGGSEYLRRKRVQAETGLRFFEDGTVLVPMMRYDGKPRLMGLQKIAPDGTKRFNAGMAKEGCSCRLGRAPADGDVIGIAEGLATALSVRQALGHAVPVFVAFDAGSLAVVARLLRALWPSSPFVFFADDDYATAGNPGTSKAEAAAVSVGNARVVVPQFARRPPDSKFTDFNDLHCAEGIEAVVEQLAPAVEAARSGSALAPAGAAASVPAGGAPLRRDVVRDLLRHYVLIRGTDTVWDGENREIMTVGNLRLAVGKREVDYWLVHPERRTVLRDRVVFDPTDRVSADDHVNLFDPREMAVPPGARTGSYARILELLQFLCAEEGRDLAEVTDWVLNWCAFPLQHPGAKLHTAVVMAGSEGTGKNLFWGAIKDLYGRYGGIITQTELESPYTAWRSRKLFILANEVLTRQEMRHQVGKIKNLVTESDLPIDEKYMPLRYEANHMNLVFLSNERQPLFLSRGDRRFQVIRTPDPKPESYYTAIADELRDGGLWALREMLLARDLGDFKPWTKPVMTAAKDDLIEQGLSSVEVFYRDWRGGETGVPFCSATSDDLYRAYRRHCDRIGERAPAKINRWRPELLDIGRADGVVSLGRKRLNVANAVRQHTIIQVGSRPDGSDVDSWWKSDVIAFRDALGGSDDKSGSAAR